MDRKTTSEANRNKYRIRKPLSKILPSDNDISGNRFLSMEPAAAGSGGNHYK